MIVMTNLKDSELCQITGGFLPFAIPVATILGILATDAFNHADQLIDGFKQGWQRP
ncbi:hypothetical protein FD51_GL000766 [Lacticaseibacillus zeae DSM 20178 = KCTC 3804]|uniref:Bacteriocin leader domain-containing protein n=1 Tax=Lacticaseibacillus zeae DSM 20178 = KCTC 3804 TaxID=1423816 RepID=A0A0R1ERS1_LACZE|nr:hypothetical protein FD51_GL000766 [Lacticaseibacillus zeae DSM 20178 = KCTC 3804]